MGTVVATFNMFLILKYVTSPISDFQNAFNSYTLSQHWTHYSKNGGPKQVGNRHSVDCGDDSMLFSFNFDYDSLNDQVRIIYSCIEYLDTAIFPKGTEPRETSQTDSGELWTGRNSMQSLSKHEVNCNSTFITSWFLRQWSHSMSIMYQCTNHRTSFPEHCRIRRSADVTANHHKLSAFRFTVVKCTHGTALTQFKFDNKVFEYTCCPQSFLVE